MSDEYTYVYCSDCNCCYRRPPESGLMTPLEAICPDCGWVFTMLELDEDVEEGSHE